MGIFFLVILYYFSSLSVVQPNANNYMLRIHEPLRTIRGKNANKREKHNVKNVMDFSFVSKHVSEEKEPHHEKEKDEDKHSRSNEKEEDVKDDDKHLKKEEKEQEDEGEDYDREDRDEEEHDEEESEEDVRKNSHKKNKEKKKKKEEHHEEKENITQKGKKKAKHDDDDDEDEEGGHDEEYEDSEHYPEDYEEEEIIKKDKKHGNGKDKEGGSKKKHKEEHEEKSKKKKKKEKHKEENKKSSHSKEKEVSHLYENKPNEGGNSSDVAHQITPIVDNSSAPKENHTHEIKETKHNEDINIPEDIKKDFMKLLRNVVEINSKNDLHEKENSHSNEENKKHAMPSPNNPFHNEYDLHMHSSLYSKITDHFKKYMVYYVIGIVLFSAFALVMQCSDVRNKRKNNKDMKKDRNKIQNYRRDIH